MSSKVVSRSQCPECKKLGYDNSADNLANYDDGHSFCYRCNHLVQGDTNLSEEVTYEYCDWRGITRDTYKFYGALTKIDHQGAHVSIGFPYPSGGCKVRRRDDKEFYSTGEVKGLFGFDRFEPGSHKTITITEGELDACSLYQITRTPCVSVRGASSAAGDVGVLRSELNLYERILLAFDNDTAGREATAAVARLFDPAKVFVVKFTNRKDANEYLQHGCGDDLLNLWHSAKQYVPANVICDLSEFTKELTVKPKQGVPYPIRALTKMTYGMRTGEMVLLKAPEKVGKTTLMHLFEYQLLKETQDNVAAIFIEEPHQRHLQALASLELKKPVHLPDTVVTDVEVEAAVQRVVGKDGRLFLYSHYGSSDPAVLLDTIRYLVSVRHCHWVLFDHISMACTGIAGEKDERRALEYLATQLEMMVKELDFGLIMVSHVNDFGQTRGSHYLTKLADIVISLSRDTMAQDSRQRNTINISVPFNRFCASSGFCCGVEFDDITYTLTETEAANDNGRTSGFPDTPWPTSGYSRAA